MMSRICRSKHVFIDDTLLRYRIFVEVFPARLYGFRRALRADFGRYLPPKFVADGSALAEATFQAINDDLSVLIGPSGPCCCLSCRGGASPPALAATSTDEVARCRRHDRRNEKKDYVS